MRTNILSLAFGSEQRRKVVETLLDYPGKQWSCAWLEDASGVPHTTVFRTLRGLVALELIKMVKVNRKDILYEIVWESPIIKAMRELLRVQKNVGREIARMFAREIQSKKITAILLYGSIAKGTAKPDSDIDILIIIKKHDKAIEEYIYDTAGALSVKYNKTISPLIMDLKEIEREKQGIFLQAVKEDMEVLCGKSPF